MRLDPGSRKCFLTRTTAGEKTPERTDEQGETVRLTEEAPVGDHPPSLRSQPSDRIDSLDEAKGGHRSAESAGLLRSSDTRRPELTLPGPEPQCLSVEASFPTGTRQGGGLKGWTTAGGEASACRRLSGCG